jgi:hypothetical protein
MEAAARTKTDGGADGGAEADGGANGDRGDDPDGGGDNDGGGDPDGGGDLDGDASVEGGHRGAGPVNQIRPQSHRHPDSPPPPTARRLLPRLRPTARAPLVRRFWAAHLSSELVFVVKMRLWWDRDFRPRDFRLNFQLPVLRVPSLRVSIGYVSQYQK